MKTISNGRQLTTVLCLGTLVCIYASVAQAVEKGDSLEDVIAELGRPRGRASSQRGKTYFYDRGMVTFSDGKATHTSVITTEEGQGTRGAKRA